MKIFASVLILSAFAISGAVAAPVTVAAVTSVGATAAVGSTAAVNLDASAGVGVTQAGIGTTTQGKVWVNNVGLTLYTFEKDTALKSNCNGDCATEWPPLKVASGATASGDWTIVTRDDASLMWAYKGHPLYTFKDDTKAGDITGDNKDGFHAAL